MLFLKNSVFLIVDESTEARDQLKGAIKSLGYRNIMEADSVATGIKTIVRAQEAGTPITLVISNWVMPAYSGLEFLQQIRAMSQYRHLAFIMLTDSKDLQTVQSALASGVNSHLAKPFTRDDLEVSLQSVWERLKGQF